VPAALTTTDPGGARARRRWWWWRSSGPQRGTIELTQRRIYILPTQYGIAFAIALLVMLAGSINYSLNLGYLLVFLLAATGVVSVLHTFRNLAGLRFDTGAAPPVHAGETAHFELQIRNPTAEPRHALGLARGTTILGIDCPAGETRTVSLPVATERRGRLRAGRWTVFTRYPVGLAYAWARLEPDAVTLVYPRPDPSALPLSGAGDAAGAGLRTGPGEDDFAGLRGYRPGDPLQRIAWKAAARGRGLQVKQFSGGAGLELLFDWDELPPELDTEQRLSRLTGWVLEAARLGLPYGLRLPGRSFEPGLGGEHRARLLEALALHGLD
jgi:uncharacterized protein (DUF58 family)